MFWFGYSISFRHRDREREWAFTHTLKKKRSGKHPYKCQNVSKLSRVQQTLFTKHSRKLLKLSTALQINSHITLTHILPCQEKERQRQRDRETETERHRERQREKQRDRDRNRESVREAFLCSEVDKDENRMQLRTVFAWQCTNETMNCEPIGTGHGLQAIRQIDWMQTIRLINCYH